jgi:hypothetical protein
MNKRKFIKTDPNNRSDYKELQRKQDLSDLINKRLSGNALQKRNSIFTNIDWSEVKIFEPNGYSWQANNRSIKSEV